MKPYQSKCIRAESAVSRVWHPPTAEKRTNHIRVFTFNSYYIILFLLCFLLTIACSQQPQLNSERIASRYGNYGIEVLRSDGNVRVSDLYSSDDGYRTTRTLAIVHFRSPVDSRVADLHQAIVTGASIGATFKSAGWHIYKSTIEICQTHPVAASKAHLSGMHLDGNPQLAVHRYRFGLQRDNQQIDYAVITEIHHPDYLSANDLKVTFVRDSQDYVETDEACLVHK